MRSYINRSTCLFLSQSLLLNVFSKYVLQKERNWELETQQNAKERQNSAALAEFCCKDKKSIYVQACTFQSFFSWELEISWANPSYLVVKIVVNYIPHCVGWYYGPRTWPMVGMYQFQTWPFHFCIWSATNFLLVQYAVLPVPFTK